MSCSFSFLVWFLEHLDPVNVKIAELREALESVVAEQKYLKARDTRHRHSKFSSFILCSLFLFYPFSVPASFPLTRMR